MNEEIAALKLQSFFRSRLSRKKTNHYGSSQGKEIEIYLPFAVKKKDSEECDYTKMIGGYKTILCVSDLFSVQMDFMSFSFGRKLKIPEIVTAPFRSPGEIHSNLVTEEEIDAAVGDFIAILENFTAQTAVSTPKQIAYLKLSDLITLYNEKNPKHPLRMASNITRYLANPIRKELFTNKIVPVKIHQNIDICLVYAPNIFPRFDESATPRTIAAADAATPSAYAKGELLVHVQKTFSLPVEKYNPEFLALEKNSAFHNTEQQLAYLMEARQRAERFIQSHPLPENAKQERILGLLTICVEQVLTVVHAKNYINLHEKADRPVLSIRHTLHYVKKMVCNKEECEWFTNIFRHHRRDINSILCQDSYTPDYRGRSDNYGSPYGLPQEKRYDVIFDLFGDFSNGSELSEEDLDNPLSLSELTELKNYGTKSWEAIYDNHMSLSGRTHLRMQKVGEHYEPLFEARRIGIMTPAEFRSGASRVHLGQSSTCLGSTVDLNVLRSRI